MNDLMVSNLSRLLLDPKGRVEFPNPEAFVPRRGARLTTVEGEIPTAEGNV